jgi:hypothetical protein
MTSPLAMQGMARPLSRGERGRTSPFSSWEKGVRGMRLLSSKEGRISNNFLHSASAVKITWQGSFINTIFFAIEVKRICFNET